MAEKFEGIFNVIGLTKENMQFTNGLVKGEIFEGYPNGNKAVGNFITKNKLTIFSRIKITIEFVEEKQ